MQDSLLLFLIQANINKHSNSKRINAVNTPLKQEYFNLFQYFILHRKISCVFFLATFR